MPPNGLFLLLRTGLPLVAVFGGPRPAWGDKAIRDGRRCFCSVAAPRVDCHCGPCERKRALASQKGHKEDEKRNI